ncbi:lysozyme [Azospira inquinata]|uniref:Lysozyme n=1 Tax=Azospira inquinata TaxID=2785627 RepID=A0A975SNC3_9RHOO|nr:lysozyme [Azospira inquinata]QWT45146.1 lysozyme [Azospira inquinata]QWT49521.1 lysozyme [Azospira inquinata]
MAINSTTNEKTESEKEGISPRLWKPWKISDSGLKFLAIQESGIENGTFYDKKHKKKYPVTNGFILTCYLDQRDLPTIGMGHLVKPSDKISIGDSIPLEKAQEFASNDLASIEEKVNCGVKVPLHQYEYDSLVSIGYNCGTNGISKLLESINTKKYSEIPSAIEKYRAKGNSRRRKQEASLFFSGEYNANH